MRTRRIISILLSVCMLLSVAGIAASAATTAESAGAADLTIAATSNIGATTTQTVDSTSGQVTVTYYVNTDAAKLLNVQWTLTYDEEYLTFDTTNGANLSYSNDDITDVDEYFMMPVANGDGVFNFGRTGEVIGNTSDLAKYNLTNAGNKVALVEVKFVPKKAGSTTVNLDVEVAQVVKTGATDETTLIKNSAFVDETVDIAASAEVTTGSEEAIVDSNLRFSANDMSLANSLEINFYLNSTRYNSFNDIYVEFTRNDAYKGEVTTVVGDGTYVKKDGRDLYLYAYKGVNPQLLGDDIVAVIYGTSVADGKLHCSEPFTFKPLEYTYSLINDNASKTMAVDLINYAAAAQAYSGYKAESPVNADLTPAQQAYGTQTPHSYTDIYSRDDLQNKKVNFRGASVVLGSSIGAEFTFKAVTVNGVTIDMRDVTVKVSVGNRQDVGVYTYADFTDAGDGNFTVLFDKAYANELSDKIVAKAYDKSGNLISNTFNYSIESYVAQSINSADAKTKNLFNTMMNYGYSVMAYGGKTAPVV